MATPGFGMIMSIIKWIQAVFRWLRGFVPGIQLLFGVVALVVTGVSGYLWFSTQDTMLQTFLTALTYRVAPTSGDYKALEALILSVLSADRETQNTPPITKEVDYQFEQVVLKLQSNDKSLIGPLKFKVKNREGGYGNTDPRSWQQFFTLDGNQGTTQIQLRVARASKRLALRRCTRTSERRRVRWAVSCCALICLQMMQQACSVDAARAGVV
jgi:hypothetical protein